MTTAVASRNSFALLIEEDDFPSSTSVPGALIAAEKKVDTLPYMPRLQSRRTGPSSRGGKYYMKDTSHKILQTHGIAEIDETHLNQIRKGEHIHRGKDRGKRNKGVGRVGATGRGRPFDRHSQTDKVDTDKKLQQSWGGGDGKREVDVEEAASLDVVIEITDTNTDWAFNNPETGSANWGDIIVHASAETKDVSVPGLDERSDPKKSKNGREYDNTLTLEQYHAQKEREIGALPRLEGVREANEGSDISLWDNVVPLSKGGMGDAYFVGKTKSAPKQRNKKDEKIYLEIDARFDRSTHTAARSVRIGDRRGDRGSRFGRGRGGDNTTRTTGVIDAAYEAAFPTLS